jgi:FkbM family methyltransferase
MGVRERMKSLLVGTRLDPLARTARWIWQLRHLGPHPELHAFYCEERILPLLFERLLKPDWNCIDVGAHLGSSVSEFVQLAPGGRHVAFEPTPRKAAWLRKKFPALQVHECALSNGSARAGFYVHSSESAFSGLCLEPPRGQAFAAIDVEQVRLDDVIDPDYRADLLKIDVEGAELWVLEGSQQLLRRSRPHVVFECTKKGNKATGTAACAVFEWLEAENYDVYMPAEYLAGRGPLSLERFTAAQEYPFQALNFLAVPR